MKKQLNDRAYLPLIITISILVPTAIASLTYIPKGQEAFDLRFLPFLNAIINSCVSVCLVLGLLFIRQKDMQKHRICMFSALSLSVLFLVSYVIYHSLVPETKFCGTGWQRPVYFMLLISHITLAVPAVPLALLAVYQGVQKNFWSHKKVVRWAYPIWLYVSITGPVIYWMLSPCF